MFVLEVRRGFFSLLLSWRAVPVMLAVRRESLLVACLVWCCGGGWRIVVVLREDVKKRWVGLKRAIVRMVKMIVVIV
jgi:hypothetical protein